MALNIDIETIELATLVHVVGEIDGSSAPEAQAKILPLAEPGCKIAIDMGGVTYMSSAGLRLLLVIYRTIKGRGGEVVLIRLPDDLRDTMEMTGFLDFFQYFDSVDAGLAALAD
jgi:anti-sigma B factor antagonist